MYSDGDGDDDDLCHHAITPHVLCIKCSKEVLA